MDVPVPYKKRMLEEARAAEKRKEQEQEQEKAATAKREREDPTPTPTPTQTPTPTPTQTQTPVPSSSSQTSTHPSRPQPVTLIANSSVPARKTLERGEPQAKRAKVACCIPTTTRAEEVFFGDHRGLFCNAESIERLLAVIAAFGWGRWDSVEKEWNRQDSLGLKLDANDLHCFACSLLLCISFALRFGFDKWKSFNDKPVRFTKLAYTSLRSESSLNRRVSLVFRIALQDLDLSFGEDKPPTAADMPSDAAFGRLYKRLYFLPKLIDAKNWWLYKFFPKQKSENIVKHFSLTEDLKTLSTMLIQSKKRLLIPKDTPAYKKLYESDKKLAKVTWGRDEDTDLMKGLFTYGLFYSNGSFSDRDTSLKERIFAEYPATFKENETIGEAKGKFNPDLAWIKNRAKLITQLYESVIKNGAQKPTPCAVAEVTAHNKDAFLSDKGEEFERLKQHQAETQDLGRVLTLATDELTGGKAKQKIGGVLQRCFDSLPANAPFRVLEI